MNPQTYQRNLWQNARMTTQTPPRWDLTNVYPSLESPELANAIAETKTRLSEFEAYLNEHHIGGADKNAAEDDAASQGAIGQSMNGYLERMNALRRLFQTVVSYIELTVTTDSFNATARKMLSEVEPLGVQLQNIEVRFRGWLGKNADVLPHVLELGGPAGDHSFYLQETAEQSRYLMSESEEGLAAELDLSGANAWSKLQGTIVSQIAVDFEVDGKAQNVSMPALLNIEQHHPDQATRKRAYEKEMATWGTVQESLAAAMNGIKGTANTLNRRRGRANAVQPSLDAARIDQATLDAMMGAMRESFPVFRKYLKAKAKRLGHAGGLPWWDLMAPVGHNERSYSWDEACEFILGNFGKFSPRLMGLAKRAFERNWIDAEQRPGKRAGAFCAEIPLTDESRILCNFDGSLDQVSTVAHELGHAFHNECLVGKTPLNALTPMTLAETASIFCETIIIDAALAQAKTADERLAILETELIGATQVIVDITSRFIFEKEVFERRANAELSPEDLCDAMLRAQKETYGDGLDESYMHKYMWTWKPHYYSAGLSFYNFPYAFGQLFALGLYSIYQKRGAAFVPEYEQLLASTGEGNAADLAARFGINIRDKAFWKSSLDVIGAKIEQYVNL